MSHQSSDASGSRTTRAAGADVALRPATAADSDFCYALHKAAMGEYVAAVWGWDEQEQRAYHERGFDPQRWQIVTVDGVDAGVMVVEHRPAELYLGRIELHPDYQGRGVGARLIRALIDSAARHGHELVLDVLTVNTRAHALYLRLGFHDVPGRGDGQKIRMRLDPRPPTAGPGTAGTGG